MPLRLATFNVENLMRRFDFSGFGKPRQQDRALALYAIGDREQYRELEQARLIALADDTRQLTALALARTRADVVCLQEVDDREALDAFERGYLLKMIGRGFPHRLVSRGNDTRGIDVALMAREATAAGEPITLLDARSHAGLTFGEAGLLSPELAAKGHTAAERVFRRDCFEVDLQVGSRRLTLFLAHLKSMTGAGSDTVPGRAASMAMRRAEALALRAIVEARFNGRAAEADWAICGDLNDYRERVVVGGGVLGDYTFTPVVESEWALDALTAGGWAVNTVERRPVLDRWTLFHTRGPQERHLCQLDYILLSPALAQRNSGTVPDIVREGQPWRTPFPPGQDVARLPRAGWDRPKASDHCPVAMTLELGA